MQANIPEIYPEFDRHNSYHVAVADYALIGVTAECINGGFIAGVFYEVSGCIKWEPQVYDSQNEAGMIADEYARIAAERENEWISLDTSIQEAEYAISELLAEMRGIWDSRHQEGFNESAEMMAERSDALSYNCGLLFLLLKQRDSAD